MDNMDKVLNWAQRDVSFLSAHDLISITYDMEITRRVERKVVCRDYKNFSHTNLSNDVRNVNWEAVYVADNIDEKVEKFTEKLQECFNRVAPKKLVGHKKLPAPWLTVQLKESMRERDRIRRRWRRTGEMEDYEKFKQLRNAVQKQVRTAKSEYYCRVFENDKDSAVVWKRLRHLGLVNNKRTDRKLACSVYELNEYFVSSSGQGAITDREYREVNTNYDEENFYWEYIYPEEICRTFTAITSGVVGIDDLPLKLLRIVLPDIVPIVEYILNYSLEAGTFPKLWKVAMVKPVPKVINPTLPEHYRPISVLPTMSKVIEKIVVKQIKGHLLRQNLYDPN